MKTTRFFFSILTALVLVAGLFAALPANSVSAQTAGPEIFHGTFGEAPHLRVDSNAVTAYKAESLEIQVAGYVSDTSFYTMESTIVSTGGVYDYSKGGYIYTQTVVTGLQAGDIVEVDNNQFYNDGTGYYSYWDQAPYWILIGDYTHVPGDTINHWLIYSEKVTDTEYRLVIGAAQFNTATSTDDLTTVIGDSFEQTRDVKVYRGPTLANPVVSSRGYTASTNEDTSTWGSPITSSSFDSGDLSITAVQETWVDDSWAGSSNGDIVEGHIFGQDAFATIQQAVTGTDSGGTIHVAAGTYPEQVYINKALTLLGPNAGISPNTGSRSAEAVIAPTGSGTVGVTLVAEVAGAVTLDGFTVRGFTDWGVYQYPTTSGEAAPAHILNNIFDPLAGTYWYAVEINNDGSTVLNNLIQAGTASDASDSYGIVTYDSSNLRIEGNVIGGVPLIGGGIIVSDWSRGGVSDVIISGNTINNTEEAIMLYGYEWEEPAGSGNWVHDGSIANVTIDHNIFNVANEAIQAFSLDVLSNLVVENNQFNDVHTTWGTVVDINATDVVTGLDLSPNWWDKATGPVPGTDWDHHYDIYVNAGPIAGEVYVPWCGDAACTIMAYPPVHNVTQDTYFNTIQAAITAATDGDTITVAAGTYNEENIRITKGITLQGAGAETTFIAPSTATNNSTIVVQNPTGNVTIDGFNFVMQPKPNYGSAVVVTGTGIGIDAATVTISNNVVTGSDDGSKSDYGFYGQINNARVVITGNVINKTGDNSITFEQQAGSTTVNNNTFYITSNPDYNPYFSMAYAGLSVSTPQIVENNTFYLDHSGTGYSEAVTFDTAVFNSWYGTTTDTGHYTNIQIRNNTIYTDGPYARGFGLVDLSAGDGMGTISGAVITGNQIIGENLTDSATYGVTLRGDIENALITDNTISNVDIGIWVRPGLGTSPVCPSISNDISENQITPVTTNVMNDCTSGSIDVSPNWWGSILGPAAGSFSGTAVYDPWCGDAACSFLVSATEPAESGFYVQDGELRVKGNINIPGGIVINEPHLTILLEDGTVIQNNSPCFIVDASYTTITTESIGGAKCVPTDGSNGIDVAAGLSNITIEGIEFDGTGQTTGDGIRFAGAVQDIVLVDNYMHDLDSDGIEFAGDVAEVVNIQGNMFKNNTGFGINNLGTTTVGAEYNSWGNVGGPAAGDGVNGPVTSTPFTHADLYLVSSGTPWANQVVSGQTITYTVMAHLVNVNAADFVLTYPAELTYVSSTPSGNLGTESILHDGSAHTLQFIGYNTANVSGDLPLFTVTFTGATVGANLPLSFSYAATSGFGMAGFESSSNVYVNEMVNGAVTIISALPTITSTDIQGYYLTGDSQEFNVRTVNPAGGGIYQHAIFNYRIAGADLADIASFEVLSGTTWVPMPLTQDGSDLIGSFGLAPTGFTMPEPYDVTTTFRITFNTAKSYPFTLTLNDLDAGGYTLATLESTAVVYTKPTISSATPAGPFQQGLAQNFTLTVTDPSGIPEPFELHFNLPAGTVLVYNSISYNCDATGCTVPVTLDAATNDLVFNVTFPAAFTGDITVDLYDSDWTPADRLLATYTQTGVVVYGNVASVTGTVSMQGRTYRGGVQMTLTAAFGFGPYTVTSIDQISGNLVFSNLASGIYTITTNQARYLDITADMNKIIDVSSDTLITALELKGGDANDDQNVNLGDASAIGSNYGATGDINADVNFSGRVDVFDLAMVGGNFTLNAANAYAGWAP